MNISARSSVVVADISIQRGKSRSRSGDNKPEAILDVLRQKVQIKMIASDLVASAPSPFSDVCSTEIWGMRAGRPIFRCPDTGALFFNRDTLAEEDYQDYYPYLASFDSHRFDWELRIRRRKYRRQLRVMERLSAGNVLVDIGAGPGYFCRVASEEGWNATGIEISAEAIRHGKEQFGVRYATLDEIPDGSVDVITSHHVLEHVADPVGFLQTIRGKLNGSGLLVVHVPHEQPLTFLVRDRLRRLLGIDGDTYCTLYGDVHISGFTSESLCRVIERQGFKTHFVRSVGMWSTYYDPFFTMNYIRNKEWIPLVRKAVRNALECAGNPMGRGDSLVGYFNKLA